MLEFNQKVEAVNAVIDSLNQGKYVHLSGFVREIYKRLSSEGLAHTTTLEDNLTYFCIDRSTKLKFRRRNNCQLQSR